MCRAVRTSFRSIKFMHGKIYFELLFFMKNFPIRHLREEKLTRQIENLWKSFEVFSHRNEFLHTFNFDMRNVGIYSHEFKFDICSSSFKNADKFPSAKRHFGQLSFHILLKLTLCRDLSCDVDRNEKEDFNAVWPSSCNTPYRYHFPFFSKIIKKTLGKKEVH